MRPALLSALRVAAATAVVLPAARAAAQRAYVAPTSETVFSTTEERQSDPPVHLIFVENRSTVPVTVFSVSLTGCENIKQSCTPQRANLKIGPGRRQMAVRVEPKNPTQGFRYHFSFGWRADSAGLAAVSALAAAGDSRSREQLEARRRADSLDRAMPGVRELTRDDFAALAGRAAALRALPDSLALTPGERTTLDRIQLLVVDVQGAPLGRTRWVRWQSSSSGAVRFTPPDALVAVRPGRLVLRFSLAEEAQALLGRSLGDLEVPVVAAYPPDPHAPSFAGMAVDADRLTPLACTQVALEDSAQNVVARGRTTSQGTFVLTAPRAGTYRVRLETFGWAPTYGPAEVANPDEVKQGRYAARFTEPLVARLGAEPDDLQHAYPTSVVGEAARPARSVPARPGAAAARAPVIRGVTFSGSGPLPILGIVGNAPPGTSWVQFVVDSTGRADAASALMPPDADPATVASVQAVLPRMRFSPARQAGTPTCELLRMQVTLSGGAGAR